MKNRYIKPEMFVIALYNDVSLLAGTGGGNSEVGDPTKDGENGSITSTDGVLYQGSKDNNSWSAWDE